MVGRCQYCSAPWDQHSPGITCAVCRELVLACPSCRRAEYHCTTHAHLSHCYFANLNQFSLDELRQQAGALAELEAGFMQERSDVPGVRGAILVYEAPLGEDSAPSVWVYRAVSVRGACRILAMIF